MVVARDPRVIFQVPHGRNTRQRIRRFIYIFLDHPRHLKYAQWYCAMAYHLLLFSALFIAALIEGTPHNDWMAKFVESKLGFSFDIYSACDVVTRMGTVVLILEYIVRVVVCTADARFNCPAGRIAYIKLWVNILELVVTLFAFVSAFFPGTLPDDCRYVVVIRVIHWDRGVHAAKLLKRIFRKGGLIIMVTYFAAFLLVVSNAITTFYCEDAFRGNVTANADEIGYITEGFWFSFVTSLGIGYGDKVPKTGLCRASSVLFGYSAIVCLYSMQTAISLELTKHVEEEEDTRTRNRKKNIAAKLIQFWYRWHLAKRGSASIDKYCLETCRKLAKAKEELIDQRGVKSKSLRLMKTISKRTRRASASVTSPAHIWRRKGSLPNHFSEVAKLAALPFFSARSRSHTTSESALDKAIAHDLHSSLRRGSAPHSSASATLTSIHELDNDVFSNGPDSPTHCGLSPLLSETQHQEEIQREFKPLVILFQFLLFGHYKRKFKNLNYRKTQDERVEEQQGQITSALKERMEALEKTLVTIERIKGKEMSLDQIGTRIDYLEELVRDIPMPGSRQQLTRRPSIFKKQRKMTAAETPVIPRSRRKNTIA